MSALLQLCVGYSGRTWSAYLHLDVSGHLHWLTWLLTNKLQCTIHGCLMRQLSNKGNLRKINLWTGNKPLDCVSGRWCQMKSICPMKEFLKLLRLKYHKKKSNTWEKFWVSWKQYSTEIRMPILLPISLKLVNTEIMRDALGVYIHLSYLRTLL